MCEKGTYTIQNINRFPNGGATCKVVVFDENEKKIASKRVTIYSGRTGYQPYHVHQWFHKYGVDYSEVKFVALKKRIR